MKRKHYNNIKIKEKTTNGGWLKNENMRLAVCVCMQTMFYFMFFFIWFCFVQILGSFSCNISPKSMRYCVLNVLNRKRLTKLWLEQTAEHMCARCVLLKIRQGLNHYFVVHPHMQHFMNSIFFFSIFTHSTTRTIFEESSISYIK